MKFRLTNLRELSTEEQLRLNGGFNTACNCTCSSCECTNESPSADVDKVVNGVAKGVKESLDK